MRYLAATLLALLFLTPLIFAVIAAFKSPAELVDPLSLPHALYLRNFVTGWQEIGGSLLNSISITFPAVSLSVLIGCMAAYPLSMMPVKNSRFIYLFLLTGMFVPFQIVQIPIFFLMRALGLYNNIVGLWLVHAAYGVPICTFFMRNFFSTVPRSIYEAAQLDGCGPAEYFFKILLPASVSGIAALTIVQSRSIWNDLLFAMTLTNDDSTMPVTAKLNGFVSATQVDYGSLMASALISILPMLLIFLCFQKAFVRGLLGGSSK
jgi:ABC-type glycerol-3-phosphate transport system permease component